MISRETRKFIDRAHIKRGYTWSDEHKRWVTHTSLGADVRKVPKGWQKVFDPPNPTRRVLKIVSIVYDFKLFTDGDYERKGGDF